MAPFESLGTIFLSSSNGNYDSIFYHFRNKARYWPKIAIFIARHRQRMT